tara:strand:+ start:246 stop:479 length:234 start_codon:yes stop_codon:yes gene_type:complete
MAAPLVGFAARLAIRRAAKKAMKKAAEERKAFQERPGGDEGMFGIFKKLRERNTKLANEELKKSLKPKIVKNKKRDK